MSINCQIGPGKQQLFGEATETTTLCPDITAPNGKIIYDPFRPRAVGTLAILLCDIGYVPNGIILTSCGSNGQWSKRLDECKSQFPSGPVCPALTGTWAWLFCSLGHIVNGSAITFCDNNGQWSSPIGSCNSLVAPSNAVRCPELTVSNGAVFYDILKSREVNTHAIMLCKLGYLPEGTTTVICGQTGVWSGSSHAKLFTEIKRLLKKGSFSKRRVTSVLVANQT
ncbi:unnamed protein product [Toxocara canis]|uniref:Sushi domain-containing protein n=1 Tax=Toxocara canis TaxID=6265 RepID=A0A183UT36_TOXCA|nr:unnamed protein product [Toxocara canis]